MAELYPLKFKPIFKERLWGGAKINQVLGKNCAEDRIGESWEISTVDGDVSEVANGAYTGKLLTSLIKEFKAELVGAKIYDKFGDTLPLLIKFIDANQDLSVQVHPNDELAQSRHQSLGKTEMWYVMQADEGAQLSVGFNQKVNDELYLEKLNTKALPDILNYEEPKAGDVFFIPAGRIHYIGKGILLAEIQQSSDVTYRIYDFDRRDADGKLRELHTEQALDALDFNVYETYKTDYLPAVNQDTRVVDSEFFTTHMLSILGEKMLDYKPLDSFVIHVCVEGFYTIGVNDEEYVIKQGESVLLPAALKTFKVKSETESKVLVCYCR